MFRALPGACCSQTGVSNGTSCIGWVEKSTSETKMGFLKIKLCLNLLYDGHIFLIQSSTEYYSGAMVTYEYVAFLS